MQVALAQCLLTASRCIGAAQGWGLEIVPRAGVQPQHGCVWCQSQASWETAPSLTGALLCDTHRVTKRTATLNCTALFQEVVDREEELKARVPSSVLPSSFGCSRYGGRWVRSMRLTFNSTFKHQPLILTAGNGNLCGYTFNASS